MRKLAFILVCPLLIIIANGCGETPAPSPDKTADASPAPAETAKKGTAKRKPKTEAGTKQDIRTKAVAD